MHAHQMIMHINQKQKWQMWFNILALLAKRFCVDVDDGRIVSYYPRIQR